MAENEPEENLSRRQRLALRRAMSSEDEDDEGNQESRNLNVSFGSLSNLNLSSDTSMLGVSDHSKVSKRPRIEIERATTQPSAGPSCIITYSEPTSRPQTDLSPQLSLLIPEEKLFNCPESGLSSSSALATPLTSKFDETSVHPPEDTDEEYFDAVDHFGAEYFYNYESDDESSSAVPNLNLFNISEDVDSLLFHDDSIQEEGISSRQSRKEVDKDKPLYNQAPISQLESLTSVLCYVQSEHLSGAGLGRLLSLIDLHLPKPNNFLKTPNRLLDALDGLNDPVHVHYYCSACYKFRKGPADNCPCETSDEDKCILFFITLPLEAQLRKMFQRPGFLEDLKYRDNRKKRNVDNIEDIYDSEVYKEAMRKFVQSCINLTLFWNTDGMQIFNSNSFSLWPFYFIINELSPLKRYLSENLLIGGLWGSVGKPHPNVYLVPIYRDLKALQHGFDVICHGENETRKVIVNVICGCSDAPARATFMNMKQHSGFYSCPVCLTKGEKPGDSTVFPYEERETLRTMPQYEEHVQWAVQNKVILSKTVKDETKWCGIKGPTVLKDIVPNLFTSMAIDAMHCLYLGLMRQMLHLWCDKDHKDEPWSIHSKLNIVNARIRKLSPPHWLHRTPQTLDKLIYWKATELRFFLFNLSLIVLNGVLLPEYYNHFALFVKVASLLNSRSISEEDLILSELFSHQFLSQFADLYTVYNMTHNLHMVQHLTRSVRLLGPLWCTSCFSFEDINGRLANFIHGTRHVGLQVQSNLAIITQLPLMVNNLKDDEVKQFCLNIHRRYRLDIKERVSSSTYCVGALKSITSDYTWAENLLRNKLGSSSAVQIFSRLLKNSILYVAESYGRGQRASSYVKFTNDDNSVRFGLVKCFLRMDFICYAVIKPSHLSSVEIQGIDFHYVLRHEFTDSVDGLLDCEVVPVDLLECVMFKVTCDNEGYYLMEPLNDFEYQ